MYRARANAYFIHTCSDYCMRAPRSGAKVAENGGIRRELPMGDGVEATPGHWSTPGRPTRKKPALEADQRGHEKLALERNVRRATQHTVTHKIGWKANGDVSALPLQSDPADPGPAEIAKVFKYVLCCGRKGVEKPKIQRQIWKDAFRRVDGRCGPMRHARISQTPQSPGE